MIKKEKINWDLFKRDINSLMCDFKEQFDYEKNNPSSQAVKTKQNNSSCPNDYTDEQWKRDQDWLDFSMKYGMD